MESISLTILTEIHRKPDINLQGRTIYRTAVRGVILRGQKLLLIHSSTVGDYKFPGGGVEEGETHAQTLEREIREECGASLLNIGNEIGAVIEYDIPAEKEFDAFKMTSHYYQCEVGDEFGVQNLEGYEQELGFDPVWINIKEAIARNKSLLAMKVPPMWLGREIFVLEYILNQVTVER